LTKLSFGLFTDDRMKAERGGKFIGQHVWCPGFSRVILTLWIGAGSGKSSEEGLSERKFVLITPHPSLHLPGHLLSCTSIH